MYLFCRDDKGNLIITEDNTYHPTYYEPDPFTSDAMSYDGKKLKKIVVSSPKDMLKMRSKDSYEATLHYTSKYILDKIPEFTKTFVKWTFLDIEVLSPKDGSFPEAKDAKYPISHQSPNLPG